jgi:nucleotidyltransferase-like protein
MTADQYVLSVIARYSVSTGPGSAAYQAGQNLYPLITQWANQYLLGVSYSGSYAKGTAVRGRTDVDLFISLAHSTPETLSDIYRSLVRFLTIQRLSPREQNVSVSVSHSGVTVDLVPGKKQLGNTTDHSLYRRKGNTWTQTNVGTHISLVQACGRLDEIRAVKIWRQLHGLEFPSFYLELTVINALLGQRKNQPAANIMKALGYISNNLTSARVVDPANSNNVISDDLTGIEKRRVAAQASISMGKPNWGQIIW